MDVLAVVHDRLHLSRPVRQSSRAAAAAHGMCSCRVPQAHSAAGERRKPAAA